MPNPVITLMTDFGHADHFVGVMKGVILGLCPHARVVDLCHELPAHAILPGAFTLAEAFPYFPPGTIHVAVVDPGVGSERRAVLVEADGHRFLAPDNGLLTLALAGRTWRAWHLTVDRYWRMPLSRTFHGRDLFSPVAGHLAAGVALDAFGPETDTLVNLSLASPTAVVFKADRFGNLITSLRPEQLGPNAALQVGSTLVTRRVSHYAEVPPGEPALLTGSAGYLEVVVNQGSAARLLRAQAGDPVTVVE